MLTGQTKNLQNENWEIASVWRGEGDLVPDDVASIFTEFCYGLAVKRAKPDGIIVIQIDPKRRTISIKGKVKYYEKE